MRDTHWVFIFIHKFNQSALKLIEVQIGMYGLAHAIFGADYQRLCGLFDFMIREKIELAALKTVTDESYAATVH